MQQGEASEVVDLVKKHPYQGHNLDIERLVEEGYRHETK